MQLKLFCNSNHHQDYRHQLKRRDRYKVQSAPGHLFWPDIVNCYRTALVFLQLTWIKSKNCKFLTQPFLDQSWWRKSPPSLVFLGQLAVLHIWHLRREQKRGRKRETRREREKDEDINKVAALVVIHSYGGHRDAVSGGGISWQHDHINLSTNLSRGIPSC